MSLEAVLVVELRRTVLMSLDDLVAASRAHILTAQDEREPTAPPPVRPGLRGIGRGTPPDSEPCRPQCNGMVEHFNGRTAAELATALEYYQTLYNNHISQRTPGHFCPLQALKA